MPLIPDEDIPLLAIDNFIFHVVHHGEDEPILLDETPIGDFEDFFLSRVRETLRGNRFTFVDGSVTRASLNTIAQHPRLFVEESKTLARAFHTRRDKRIKAGVLIVMSLRARRNRYFSLIKYDHEQVLAYSVRRHRALLRSIANSFTQSPEALQKSAVVQLTDDGGDLIVIDRKVRAEITEFFKGFLNVRRAFAGAELTQRVERVVKETVLAHKDTLPPAITSRVRERLFDQIQQRQEFEADQFFAEYFGAHGTDSVRHTFNRLLRTNDLEGEEFAFDRDAIQEPPKRRYQTIEGVVIDIQERARGTVEIRNRREGGSIITIETAKLVER